MENVRYNISPCSPQEALSYISKIDEAIYVPRNIVKADERSHYDRYTYVKNDSKVAVVYDTFAHVISITGSKPHADELMKLFGIDSGTKTVKTSTVPAQGGGAAQQSSDTAAKSAEEPAAANSETAAVRGGKRAKLFVNPDSIRRNESYVPITVIATAKGAEISTEEIYPPQRARRKLTPSEQFGNEQDAVDQSKSANGHSDVGMTITASSVSSGKPRRATISFGDEDDYGSKRDSAPRVQRPAGTGIFADIGAGTQQPTAAPLDKTEKPPQPQQSPEKRKRGRPPKNRGDVNTDNAQNDRQPDGKIQSQPGGVAQNKRRRGRPPKIAQTQQGALITAPGYVAKPTPSPTEHIMQFSRQNMADLFTRIKRSGNFGIVPDSTTEDGVAYIVSDRSGQKLSLVFSEKRVNLRIFGVYGDLFKTVRSYAEKLKAKNPVVVITPQQPVQPKIDVFKMTEPMRRLYRRVPTAYSYLSEQSRTDFICGMSDFSQDNLNISDYSVLLVPPFRALERFIFDLQRAEGIQVKMIGQAFDKDEQGKYILKRGYQQRIGSVIYAEVMVALYTEYFSRRNFFAHSDNTDGNVTRSLSDKASASRIFEQLLDVVEYNSRKLKEIGFSIEPKI